jgi:two-component system, OmpR family, phosphate regulon sensor histidine kinase PhoR
VNKLIDASFADALPDGIICMDDSAQCLWWNSAAAHLLQLNLQDAPCAIDAVFRNEDVLHFLKNNLPDVIETESPCVADRWLTLMMRPLSDNVWIIIVRDVTHTHRLDTIRKDFIANVSHELRTPLTVFRGYLEILIDTPGINQEELNNIFLQMSGQTKRMHSLVKDLLLLSRLESAEPDIAKHQPINVAGMIRSIASDAQRLSGAKNHKITIELDESLEMLGQAEELYSAFSNVVFNAIRYTPAGGHIELHWYLDGEYSVLMVKDDGVGIAEHDIPKLTQRFYRTDKARAREQDNEGTGLGLAIVKHVLLRHEGELLIESILGEGSRFYCRFQKPL